MECFRGNLPLRSLGRSIGDESRTQELERERISVTLGWIRSQEELKRIDCT